MKASSDQRGILNILLIPLILTGLLFIAAASFAAWAYSGRQDYKTNSDQKVSVAVDAAKKATLAEDTKLFAEEAKKPLKIYTGPQAYGSVQISYPKTWSAYVDTSSQATPVNGYLYPNIVPGINDQSSTFALRIQVSTLSYNQTMSQFTGLVQTGKVRVTPYALPKVPSVVGSRVDGQITSTKQGSMVVLPLRNTTLTIWTESNQFLPDFNGNVLPNSTFSP